MAKKKDRVSITKRTIVQLEEQTYQESKREELSKNDAKSTEFTAFMT